MQRTSIAVVLALVLLTLIAPAGATFIPADGAQVVRVDVFAGADRGSYELVFPHGAAISGRAGFSLPAPVEIRSDGRLLATLRSLTVELEADPAVSLGFAVTAGNAPTTFIITSANLSFSPLVDPLGYASAGVTLTDNDGTGANITGLYGGLCYEARYNGSSVFADLLPPLTAPACTSVTMSDRMPPLGSQVVLDTLSSIQTSFGFTLSAKDQASGTSHFEVMIPEPASLSLLGAAGLLLLRRRR